MIYRNTDLRYGAVAKFFHWLIFLLVLALLIVGFIMAGMDKGPFKGTLVGIHKQIGLLVLGLMAMRLFWALINPKPVLPYVTALWEKIAERSVHGLLYLCLFVMPLSGWIMSTAAGKPPQFLNYIIPFPGIPASEKWGKFFFNIHATVAWILIGLITVHILAALKHHFLDKDIVLKRMLPGDWR